MKRILLTLVAAALCGAGSVSAQFSLSGALNSLLGGSQQQKQTETTVAADNAPSKRALAAKWTYDSSAVEYRGDNALARMAVSSLRDQLADVYAKAGLTKGCGTIQFKSNGTAQAVMQGHKIDGRYDYDASTGRITLRATVEGREVECSGYVALSGGRLTLILDLNEALKAFKRAFPEMADHQYVRSVAPIVESVPGIYAGGVFTK